MQLLNIPAVCCVISRAFSLIAHCCLRFSNINVKDMQSHGAYTLLVLNESVHHANLFANMVSRSEVIWLQCYTIFLQIKQDYWKPRSLSLCSKATDVPRRKSRWAFCKATKSYDTLYLLFILKITHATKKMQILPSLLQLWRISC